MLGSSRTTDVADELRSASASEVVCPFCANLRSESVGPCPKCTMEDTPSTRRSTGERVGPWFVLQRKNPTAPGLRFSVLLGLARKGHVTARSIVRGPTTGQLWRFASQAKGVARIFGICWHCAASVSPEAVSCPRCKSPQDVPGDPDGFLEPAVSLPVMREVNSSPEQADLEQAIQAAVDEADPPVVPETRTKIREERSARPAAAGPRTAADAIMSAKELATVFQLDMRRSFARRWGARLKVAAQIALALLILAVGAGAAALFVKPEWRGPVKQKAMDLAAMTGLRRAPAPEPVALASPSAAPAPVVDVPPVDAAPRILSQSVFIGVNPPPTDRPAQPDRPPAPDAVPPVSALAIATQPATTQPQTVPPPTVTPASEVPPAVADIVPDPVDPPDAVDPPPTEPQVAAVDPPVTAPPTPEPPDAAATPEPPVATNNDPPAAATSTDPPPVTSTEPSVAGISEPPVTATTVPSVPPSTAPTLLSLDEAVERARELRLKALAAESRREWDVALALWQQIEQLPEDAQPVDLQIRIGRLRDIIQRQRAR